MKDQHPRRFQVDSDRNVGFNKKYTTIAIYVILVLLFTAALIYLLLSPDRLDTLLSTLQSIFTPILIGVIIAYLLYPTYRFFEQNVFISPATRKHQKCRRALFKAKLRYDFERRKHPDDEKAIQTAADTLTAARSSLVEAANALEGERQTKAEQRASRLEAKRKKSRPSFVKQQPPAPFNASKTLALVTTYLLFLLLISLFIWMILPPCMESIGDLLILCRNYLTKLPKLLTSFEIGRQIRDLLDQFELTDDVKSWLMGMTSTLLTGMSNFFGRLPAMLTSFVSNLTDILLGVFFSIYFLSSRKLLFKQFNKLFVALLPSRAYAGGRHLLRETDRKFGRFIQGKLLSSAILGVVSFILFGLCGIPYFQMITVIVTVTNLIPFFGPFIGAIPSGILILIAAPDKLLIFIILVLIIQQIEGNILEPYILGDSLGLEPVWIMIAIVVMGELFGIIGMVLGVPLFAVVYTLISEWCDKRLMKKKN